MTSLGRETAGPCDGVSKPLANRLDLAARREREERQREQLGDARHFYVDQVHSPVERCLRCRQPREAEVHKVGSEDYQ